MAAPLTFQGLPSDGRKHWLDAWKSAAAIFEATSPDEGWIDDLLCAWSEPGDGFAFNFAYQNMSGNGSRGIVAAFPMNVDGTDGLYPYRIGINFYDPSPLAYSRLLWRTPYKSEDVIAAWMNASLDMSGSERIVRTYTGDPDVPAEPPNYSDDIQDPTSAIMAKPLLLGAKKIAGGSFVYSLEDVTLPTLTPDGSSNAIDVTELIKWCLDNRDKGAFSIVPDLSEFSIAPSSGGSPGALRRLFDLLVPDKSLMPVEFTVGPDFDNTTFTFDVLQWDVPILSFSGGKLQCTHPGPASNMRPDPQIVPGGII